MRVRFVMAAAVVALSFLACGSKSTTSTTTPDSASGDDAGTTGNCNPACTGKNIVCDPADGKCKLDGTTTNVGAACNMSGADPACGTFLNATCNDAVQDGFPGGYCSIEPCTTKELCPVGSICAHLGGESDACFKACSSDSDCRMPAYACTNVDPLVTSGAGHKVCFLKTFACNKNADCPAFKPTCAMVPGGGPLALVCQ
jgi:hypothetical protein